MMDCTYTIHGHPQKNRKKTRNIYGMVLRTNLKEVPKTSELHIFSCIIFVRNPTKLLIFL